MGIFITALTASRTRIGSKEKAYEAWCTGYTCAGLTVAVQRQVDLGLILAPPLTAGRLRAPATADVKWG